MKFVNVVYFWIEASGAEIEEISSEDGDTTLLELLHLRDTVRAIIDTKRYAFSSARMTP